VFFGWGRPATARVDPREPAQEESELAGSRGRVPGVMFASAAVLIVGGLLVGARPGGLEAVQRNAAKFMDREVYAATVLGGEVPPPEPVEYLHIGPLAVVLAFVTVLATLALCAVLLERPRLPFAVPAAIRGPVEAGFERLRRQHSGQTGDYVAWATVGFAVFGALIAIAA
jgi:hypothetical protein